MSNLEQGSKEWLEMRKKHIGGSDISAIMGNNPWKSAYTLWLEKTGRKGPDTVNVAMQHGIDTEPKARETYIHYTGVNVIPNVLFFSKWDVAMASLDGISQDGTKITEFKCPMSRKLYDEALKEKIPQYYIDQCQWNMLISGAESCDYGVYISKIETKIITIYPDKEYQDKLLLKAVEFWDMVKSDLPPPKQEDDYEHIDTVLPNELLQHWRAWKQQNEEAIYNMKLIEEQIKETHKDKKCYFPAAGVKLNWIMRKGTVNWKSICDKWKISDEELEHYRNKSSKYSTLSVVE